MTQQRPSTTRGRKMTMYRCATCKEFTLDEDMNHTQEMADEPSWLVCPCGSDQVEEADECAECYEYAELVEGTDFCPACLVKINAEEADEH